MKLHTMALLPAIGFAVLLCGSSLFGQTAGDAAQAHVMAAKAAAGQEHTVLFNQLCAATAAPVAAAPLQPAVTQPGPPARSAWHADPVKVFDNLYFVGMTEYSAWAVNTSDGIILVDSIFDYSVGDEVVNGLTKLGLDPAKIKYVIVSHGHSDHAGGAKFLQDRFRAHVILSAADWDLLAHDTGAWPKPKRDMVATDGQRLTLGGTTLTMYLTPGHTLGTISTLIPVTDGGKPHVVAEWVALHLIGSRVGRPTSLRTDPINSGSRTTAVPRSASATSLPRPAQMY